MPCVKIQTNIKIAADKRGGLIAEVCRWTAELLGKPEKVTMVGLEREDLQAVLAADSLNRRKIWM